MRLLPRCVFGELFNYYVVLIDVLISGGPDSDFEYSTQSYTGYEPTSMRAIRARYNPYLQTRHRVDQVHLALITKLIIRLVHEILINCS